MEDNIPTPELEPQQTRLRAILDGWMTRAELAKELDVCVNTLSRRQTMRIGLPCARTRRRMFYRWEAVFDWLKQKEIRENRITHKRASHHLGPRVFVPERWLTFVRGHG
ncbi:hypothetical protein [Pseudovibrio sp. Ad26]|uniref:hypothetical protein n=1 Tax=Pseudovibrio sp. Ad26 TaxID=989410 RepID=UPI0007B23D83|nr:hypothetical protein [Pseudovibrio sp. Ad26]KZL13846.1 hypothetical protein PsAD26_01311 [Pseudovibrio sp. Ad26]